MAHPPGMLTLVHAHGIGAPSPQPGPNPMPRPGRQSTPAQISPGPRVIPDPQPGAAPVAPKIPPLLPSLPSIPNPFSGLGDAINRSLGQLVAGGMVGLGVLLVVSGLLLAVGLTPAAMRLANPVGRAKQGLKLLK